MYLTGELTGAISASATAATDAQNSIRISVLP